MADFQIHLALNAVWRVVAETNRYFASQAPWALKKTDPARMETVLWTTAEVLRMTGLMIQPFMPESAGKLLDLLAVPSDERAFAAAHASNPAWPCRSRRGSSRALSSLKPGRGRECLGPSSPIRIAISIFPILPGIFLAWSRGRMQPVCTGWSRSRRV
jgi:hypothetical protein